MAIALRDYLAHLPEKIPLSVYRHLNTLALSTKSHVVIEKAVDVMLAVDMVALAYQNSYDAAYLLSGDGDFTPAVDAVRKLGKGKKVYVASPAVSSPLRQTAHASIRLTPDWLSDCW